MIFFNKKQSACMVSRKPANALKKYSVKFEETLYGRLKDYLLQDLSREQLCLLYCHVVESDKNVILLPKEIIKFHEDEYSDRSIVRVTLKAPINDHYLNFARGDYRGLIYCHSHPFEKGEVFFSHIDDANDRKEMDWFYSQIPKGKTHNGKNDRVHALSMVFGQNTVAARGFDTENKALFPVDKITVIGASVRQIIPANKKVDSNPSTRNVTDETRRLDRQVLAFGEAGRTNIEKLKVAIIGVGGIGSIVAEGICRMGVKDVLLVDADRLEVSNLNRWQGGKPDDIGGYKVEIMREKLVEMFPGIHVKTLAKPVYDRDVISALRFCDCLLGCLDNRTARYFLNRFACQYLIPYIDGATSIFLSNDAQNKIDAINVRMAAIIPGLTRCMECSQVTYYDKFKARTYFMDKNTRENMERRGYIKGRTDIKAPSVYPLNMSVSSLMLFEFLNLFVPYKPVYWNTCLNLMDLNNKKVIAADTKNQREDHDENCIVCNDYLATGDDESLERFYNPDKRIELPK